MLVFPNCKINIGLIITGKREDGFHNIETVFYPIQLNDALEIILSSGPGHPPETVFTHTGDHIDGDEKDNLCLKAWLLLKKDFPHLPAIKIHLHKAIPMGAGLGGGSADAAFTLVALNEKFALNLSEGQLKAYAFQLGSDCPFFIINKPCIATGCGEILRPINISLQGLQLILVNPRIHVNTRWAFSRLNITPDGQTIKKVPDESLKKIISQPIANWKGLLINDFEKPVFEKYPEIKTIKEALYEKGALYASMSGSGSSVYGIFDNSFQHSFNFPKNYLLRSILM